MSLMLVCFSVGMCFAEASYEKELNRLVGMWVAENGAQYPRLEIREGNYATDRPGYLWLNRFSSGDFQAKYDSKKKSYLFMVNSEHQADITFKPGNPDKIVVYGDFYVKGMGMPDELDFTLARAAKPAATAKTAPVAPPVQEPVQEPDDEGVTITITVNNYRSHIISIAFCWAGFDAEDDRRLGWYNVNPGESKTFPIVEADYRLTSGSFGFYAMGGGNVWSGNLRNVVIHKSKAFDGNPDDPIEGGETVGFQKIELSENGAATLNFAPDASSTPEAPSAENTFSEEELRQLSVFLSNISEQGILDMDTGGSSGMTIDDGIRFGIRHNYINNRKNVERCKVKNCPYGAFVIKADYVFESLKKYFDDDLAVTDFKEGKVRYKYNKADGFYLDQESMLYHFDLVNDGEPVYYAMATSARMRDKPLGSTGPDGVRREWPIIEVKGYYYNADDEDDRNGAFLAYVAVAIEERGEKDPWWVWSIEHKIP